MISLTDAAALGLVINTITVVWWAATLTSRVRALEVRQKAQDDKNTALEKADSSILDVVANIRSDLGEIKGALNILVRESKKVAD
jgi:hypothetical protein